MATTKEEMVELLKTIVQGVSVSTKTYIDAQNGVLNQKLSTLDSDIKSVIGRLDLLDKIDSEDGFDSLIERYSKLEELLSTDGNLEDVLGAIEGVKSSIIDTNARIDEVIARLDNLDGSVATLNADINGTKSKVTVVEEDVAGVKVELDDVKKSVGEITEIGTQINGRLTVLEKDINDVNSEDGTITKGLKSRVKDLETKASKIEEDVKIYVSQQAITIEDVVSMGDDICAIVNVANGVFGIPLVDCSGAVDGGNEV